MRTLHALLAAIVLAFGGTAVAHASLVFGSVTTDPSPPPAGEPVTIRLELTDPADAAVEDAIVHLEAEPRSDVPGEGATPFPDDPRVVSDRFEEVAPGVYETRIVLPEEGAWTLRFRDRTFRQEEARATITMRVGEGAADEPLSFVFPPTATGPRNLSTWLVWLVGLPVVAGAVVTVLVLRGGGGDEDASEGGA